jgi:hypothetical protein
MGDYNYNVEINSSQELTDWELDELRQAVIDFLSPTEAGEVFVEVTELDC